MVMGMQNYYRIAANINLDAQKLNRAVMTIITNRLKGIRKKRTQINLNEKGTIWQINNATIFSRRANLLYRLYAFQNSKE